MRFMWLSVGLLDLFFFKQKTAYEMRISDWSSDVCSSDLTKNPQRLHHGISDSRHWSSLHEFAAADAAVVVKLRKVAAVVEPEFARRDVAGHHQLHVRIRRLELGRRWLAGNELIEGVDRKSTRLNSSH